MFQNFGKTNVASRGVRCYTIFITIERTFDKRRSNWMKDERDRCCGELLHGEDGVHKTLTRQEAERMILRLTVEKKVMLNELLKALEQKR